MFKKGQLVKFGSSKLEVLGLSQSPLFVRVQHPVRKKPFNVRPARLTLIGNNYQAKPKCSH